MERKKAQRAKRHRGRAIVHLELFGQRVAQAHRHAAFNLPFHAVGIDGLAHIVRGNNLFHSALVIENHNLRGITVGNMAHAVRLVRGHGIGDAIVLAVVFACLQAPQAMMAQVPA